MNHSLKITPEYFNSIKTSEKKFEVRKNDRNFKVGDILQLNEYDGTDFTYESLYAKVTYILDDENYCLNGMVIMSIELLGGFE